MGVRGGLLMRIRKGNEQHVNKCLTLNDRYRCQNWKNTALPSRWEKVLKETSQLKYKTPNLQSYKGFR